MALIDTAKTRLGLGGSSINYTRPFSAKSEVLTGPSFGKRALTPDRGLAVTIADRGLVADRPGRGLKVGELG